MVPVPPAGNLVQPDTLNLRKQTCDPLPQVDLQGTLLPDRGGQGIQGQQTHGEGCGTLCWPYGF